MNTYLRTPRRKGAQQWQMVLTFQLNSASEANMLPISSQSILTYMFQTQLASEVELMECDF